MAWDTERTRKLLLDAAVEEFAARGRAGARIDRIAAAAGVNKERIYQYFGGKDALFDAVVLAELDHLAEAVPLDAATPEALIEYAGEVFDHYRERPHLARLLHWEGLELGHEPGVQEGPRTERYRAKVAVVAKCLPETARTRLRPEDVLLTIIFLATSWHVMPQLNRMILGPAEHDAERRRDALVWTIRRLVAPDAH
ncbi:AcrR family transcriptional regulator [Thermocatellispora tengchongensis]|uniref:AcrR family transcriptional regulator n=1 Tax=Thermocatellispora tengchongensis TaxID=1073253 RepID=A0A840P2Y9_9ACTN|nr:TetR family transcriptional regulator [Thermocatellispora tengchongensis]MBB5133732.1 AcrR family transcriptional regulator [Thermocatellispora tengchongensis]